MPNRIATYPCFALDAEGGTYLIGGTAVIPTTGEQLEPLLAFLNSRLSGWYRRSGDLCTLREMGGAGQGRSCSGGVRKMANEGRNKR